MPERTGRIGPGAPRGLALAMALWAATASGGDSPFGVRAAETSRDGARAVEVSFTIPAGHILYADRLSVAGPDGQPLERLDIPAPHRKKDAFEDREVEVYTEHFTAAYRAPAETRYEIAVGLQGCNDEVCFRPETRRFVLPEGIAMEIAVPARPAAAGAAASSGPGGWRVLKRATGYRSAGDFLRFLDLQDTSDQTAPARAGLATLLLILLGGVALNLTPCVLPMIPVNLAIIGAGAQGGSRRRGLALGGVYGAGIAFVYGALGLFVVLTGTKFGTLNSSPWFNAAVAAVFVILGLAMVDVFAIDFSRFQPRVGAPGSAGALSKRRLGLAFVLGALAALLAGACVAPVVITVLLLAGRLYTEGHAYGLLLPFVLGLGMGIPWPVAGAGLAFLPKPGRWMVAVKYVFAAFIFAMAVHYGLVAWRGFRGPAAAGGAPRGEGVFALSATSPAAAWDDVAAAARAGGRPVVVDFWATWCKNCRAMEKTTFRDPAVVERMKAFVVVKYQAERPNEPPARELLDRWGVLGLPTYLILEPPGYGIVSPARPDR